MNDTVKGSDTIFGSEVPDSLTAAEIAKLDTAARLVGPGLMAALPTNERMRQVLVRALAHDEVPEKYAGMFSQIAMLLTVAELIRTQTADKLGPTARILPSTRPAEELASAKEPISIHAPGEEIVLESDDYIQPVTMGCGVGSCEHGSFVIVRAQIQDDDGDLADVVARMSPDEADNFGDGMKAAAAAVRNIHPAASTRTH